MKSSIRKALGNKCSRIYLKKALRVEVNESFIFQEIGIKEEFPLETPKILKAYL